MSIGRISSRRWPSRARRRILREENATDRAERVIAEELKRWGWTEEDPLRQPKKAPGKLDLAARLRRETILPLKWIAARVHLGTPKSANGKLQAWMRVQAQPTGQSAIVPVATQDPAA
jgi:hypothetical protein